MKNVTKYLLSALGAMLIVAPTISWGAAATTPGTVRVFGTQSGSNNNVLNAEFSVRFNPSVAGGFVAVGLTPGIIIVVNAIDSSTGVSFVCLLSRFENTTLFDQIEKLYPSLTNGATIAISREVTSSKCNAFGVQTSSRTLN